MCGQFFFGPVDDGLPCFGELVLTVIQAPSVPPCGEVTSLAKLWPGVTTLEPRKGCPPAEEPLFLLGVSVALSSRGPGGGAVMMCTHTNALQDVVLSVQDCCIGWLGSDSRSSIARFAALLFGRWSFMHHWLLHVGR